LNGRIDFFLDDITPAPRDVVVAQGMPLGAPVPDRIGSIVDQAIDAFRASSKPVGVVHEVEADTLAGIVEGGGPSAPDFVLGIVSARGGSFALYAATVGREVSERIAGLFADGDFALGAALDAAASVAADRCSQVLSDMFLSELRSRGAATGTHHVLGYSPGYCGWHLSAQRELFEHLQPERIGISLNEGFLMEPTKSVSGVLVSGPTPVHDFQPGFSYCSECRSRSCQFRIRRLHALDGAGGHIS
jgi:hypothetical protein